MPKAPTSAGPEAAELAASAGLTLDPWQGGALVDALGERADGTWAASEVGLIVPRQNGKGGVLEARALGGLYLFGERLILWSAHEFKALDVATPILTGRGWSTMGDLVDGDEVFALDGQATKVVAAHPVRHGRPCFRITFDDGQQVVADAEHLWEVVESSAGRLVRRVLTTAQIVDAGVSTVVPRGSGRPRRSYRFRVDLPSPVAGQTVDLPVHPWLLGAWLGDGTTAKGELTCGRVDLDYVLGRLDALGESYRVRPDSRWPDRVFTVIVAGLAARLRSAGVLGCKRIPGVYFTASVSQRRELLAGVMDTDGTVSAHQVAVTMVNARLMGDVASLVRSLGYKASLREFRARMGGRDAGPMYRVQFSASQDVSPFGMPRKSAKMRPRHKRVTRSQYNAIVSVEPVESRPTRCITVAHESGLYLVGRGFVPTHNTSTEAFLRVKRLIQSTRDMDKRVLRIRTAHGEEGFEFRNGARLRFVARSGGSGRGFSGDTVVLDEAFALQTTGTSALIPTLSARPNPQVWYTSSAPLLTSEVLRKICKRGRAGTSRRLAYLEWCADQAAEWTDPVAWAEANPALGMRLDSEFMATELEALGEDFGRERLGIWHESGVPTVVDMRTWAALADVESVAAGQVAMAIDVRPDHGSASIGAAGDRTDGLGHIEVIEHRPGTRWIVPRVVELNDRWRPPGWVVDGAGAAGALIPELREAGIEPHVTGVREAGQSCARIYREIIDGQVRHLDQTELNAALSGAAQRPLGELWAWDRRHSQVDITPLVAVTLARHGWAVFGRGSGDPLDNIW